MSRPRATATIALLALGLTACGARTSIDPSGTGGGAGGSAPLAGAGGDDSVAPATGSGAGGADARCAAETFGGPGTDGGQRVEVDEGHAYWITVDGRLVRASFGGGTPEVLLDDLVDAGDLALDGDRVVVAAEGRILAVPRAGGVASVLVEGVGSVVTIAADASGLYWMSGGSGILAYSLERLAPDGTRSLLVSPVDFGIGVALTPTHVVFTAQALGDLDALDLVARVPKTGGAVEVLASGRADPTNVFVRGEDVYWTEQLDATGGPTGVVRLTPGAAPVRILTAPAGALPILSAATSSTVVLTALDERGALVLAAPLDGGETVVLAEGPGFFLEPAATADRVAVTVQPTVGDPDARTDVEVRVLCP